VDTSFVFHGAWKTNKGSDVKHEKGRS